MQIYEMSVAQKRLLMLSVIVAMCGFALIMFTGIEVAPVFLRDYDDHGLKAPEALLFVQRWYLALMFLPVVFLWLVYGCKRRSLNVGYWAFCLTFLGTLMTLTVLVYILWYT